MSIKWESYKCNLSCFKPEQNFYFPIPKDVQSYRIEYNNNMQANTGALLEGSVFFEKFFTDEK